MRSTTFDGNSSEEMLNEKSKLSYNILFDQIIHISISSIVQKNI